MNVEKILAISGKPGLYELKIQKKDKCRVKKQRELAVGNLNIYQYWRS